MPSLKPFPRGSPNDVVVVRSEVWNRLVEAVERLDKLSVAPPLQMVRSPVGYALSLSASFQAEAVVPCILIQNGGANGTASSIPGWTYDAYSINVSRGSPTGKLVSAGAPMVGRGSDASFGAVNPAYWGLLAYPVNMTNPQIYIAFEYPQVVACTSP